MITCAVVLGISTTLPGILPNCTNELFRSLATVINCYNRPSLFFPENSLSSQSAQQLKALLVRAAKIQLRLGLDIRCSIRLTVINRRMFNNFRHTRCYLWEISSTSRRFPRFSWYDLEGTDLSTPILTYPCDTVIPTISSYLN